MYAKLNNGNAEVIINQISFVKENISPDYWGSVVEANSESIILSCANAVFELKDVMSINMKKLQNIDIIELLNLQQGKFLKLS